jgi:L-seryl-tRNA(Ser) seleniumtransferase
MTRFGGANLPREVVEAMARAAGHGLMMSDLQASVRKAIARLTRNEAAYVSCGAASGITLAVAAFMSGCDETKASLLPCSDGMRNEVIFHVCDRGTECDVAIHNSGAKTILVGDGGGATESQLLVCPPWVGHS